ncbi:MULTISPECIES: hypothetical protein [Sorangium]|nr:MULTISPECIES: hypothetical protein [Sorangium]
MHVRIIPVVPDVHRSWELVDLVLWWSQVPPPAKEVVALRRHFDDFAGVPVDELWRRLASGERRLVIGRFFEGEAVRMLDSTRESGAPPPPAEVPPSLPVHAAADVFSFVMELETSRCLR